MNALAVVLLLSALCEWFVERFVGKWLAGYPMVVAASVVGIALALVFQVDGMALMGLPAPAGSPYTGEVLTGLIIGAGSDVVHQFMGGRTV